HDELASELRTFMLEELLWALQQGKFYYSKRFTQLGHNGYPALLHEALANGTPETLIRALSAPGLFLAGASQNAAEIFGWDEFNKYYMRALCRWALMHPEYELVMARGRMSKTQRDTSQAQLGTKKDPQQFLNQLRNSP